MPIEIKELHIKINVDESSGAGNDQPGDSESTEGKDAIISACIEEIIGVLEQKKER